MLPLCWTHSEVPGHKEKVPFIGADFGEEIKETTTCTFVITSLWSPRVIEFIKREGADYAEKEIKLFVEVRINGKSLFSKDLVEDWMGNNLSLNFRTNNRYNFLEIRIPKENLSYCGILDLNHIRIIELSLLETSFEIETYKTHLGYD
jgi:hypothetical protein